MKTTSVLIATLLLAANGAMGSTRDDSKGYVASIDPPTGSIHCGFNLSGNIKSPKPEYLSYGFFYRSELNVVTALDQVHPLKDTHFTAPGTLRVTGSSKDVGNDTLMQKHKSVQAQLRVWWTTSLTGPVGGGGPQIPTLVESVWVDVPVSTPGCVTTRMTPALRLSSPTPGNSTAPSTTVKHQ